VLDLLGGVDPGLLVLVQNGWIRPLLSGWESASRALIWFTSKGEFFRELRPSLFGGTLAGLLVAALHQGGLDAAAVGEEEFRTAEAEKMGFNCVVGLPLAVHGVSLAEYLDQWTDEAHELFAESATVCARALGVDPAPGWWDEFRRAVAPIGWVRAASAKALEFRNGAVLRLAADHGIDVPVTARLLAAAYRPSER
jgi:ketopantoate reductase